jgi:hypothetical protein
MKAFIIDRYGARSIRGVTISVEWTPRGGRLPRMNAAGAMGTVKAR